MEEFWNKIVSYFQNVGVDFLYGIIILVLGIFIVKIIKRALKLIFKKGNKDEATSHFVVSLVDVILEIVVLISALATMGVNTASIITVLGTCGVAIGLALKDSLGNLACGIIIIINKPFKKGDWVEIGENAGSVDEINLFNTTLLTGDNKLVVIPNAIAVNNALVNYNACDVRRLDIDVNVAKGTDIDELREILFQIADNDVKVSKVLDKNVFLREQAIGYVSVQLRVWVPSGEWWATKFRLNEQIYKALCEKNMLPPNPAYEIVVDKKEN